MLHQPAACFKTDIIESSCFSLASCWWSSSPSQGGGITAVRLILEVYRNPPTMHLWEADPALLQLAFTGFGGQELREHPSGAVKHIGLGQPLAAAEQRFAAASPAAPGASPLQRGAGPLYGRGARSAGAAPGLEARGPLFPQRQRDEDSGVDTACIVEGGFGGILVDLLPGGLLHPGLLEVNTAVSG